MTYKRREFLKLGGAFAAGLVVLPTACKMATESGNKFGLQLYSLRDVLPADPKGVLKQVASFGYNQIEGYEGQQGLFWGMGNKDFKKYTEDLGLDFVASHCNIDDNFEQKAEQAAEIGMKYLICPYRSQSSLDEYKRTAELFNEKGEICKKNGIRFAYHNHEYGFIPVEGELPQDVYMQNTDADLVDFEMDMYWVVTAGQKPEAWFKKYPNRFKLGHVKDRMKNATERDATCTLGTGIIDYPPILKSAKEYGMDYFIVEQERYDGTTPIESAKDDAAYMKSLDIGS